MKVDILNVMGSDLDVVDAARVSFSKTSEYEYDPRNETWDLPLKDQKLIDYLARHNHWTPFAHCFASFRIKAPIFVARQLGKHQVGLVWNEVSRRYVDDEPEFYTPDEWRKRADNVKQGSSSDIVKVDTWLIGGDAPVIYEDYTVVLKKLYNYLISSGVCPEQARMVLPQSMYTEWIWSGSLAAFARVCKLRLDPHTQKETRLIAEMIDKHLEPLFPHSWKALKTHG